MRPSPPKPKPPGQQAKASTPKPASPGAKPTTKTPWDDSTQALARNTLQTGSQQLGVALSEAQTDALIGYLGLLHKWSKVYNLTAVRDPLEMVTLHLLDSLAVVPALMRHLATPHDPASERHAQTGRSTSTSTSTTPAPTPAPAPASASAPTGENHPATASANRPAEPLRLLDVGSGAGLPGVVIAIACPHIQVTCLDAVAKKAAFVQQVAASLGQTNLRGLHQRI